MILHLIKYSKESKKFILFAEPTFISINQDFGLFVRVLHSYNGLIFNVLPKRWQEWERQYDVLSTAQYVFLILQDDLHYDDDTIAMILNVKRISVRTMRFRIKGKLK